MKFIACFRIFSFPFTSLLKNLGGVSNVGDSPLHAGRISLDPGTLVCAGLRCAQRISILKFLRLDFETRFFELLSSTCGPSDSPRASQERPRQPKNAAKTSQRRFKAVPKRYSDVSKTRRYKTRQDHPFSHGVRDHFRSFPMYVVQNSETLHMHNISYFTR